MKHLGRSQFIKRLLRNQAGVEVTVDNCRAFACAVAKLRQFVPDNVHMARVRRVAEFLKRGSRID
jgi:hypothetical protein